MSTQENDTAPRKKRWNWLKIGLVLSLALNVLVVGAAGSIAYKWKSHQNHWRGQITVFKEGRRFVKSLPRDRRRQLRQIWRTQRHAMRSATISPELDKTATRALITALETKPLNAEAVERAMTKIHELFSSGFAPMRSGVGKTVRTLTPEERAAFATRLKQAINQ